MFFCYSPLQQLQQSPSGDLQTLPLSWTSSWSEVSCQTPPLTRSLNLPAENPPKQRNSLKPLKRIFKNFLFGSGHTELSGRQRTQHQPQISNHVSVSWICFYQEAENVLYRKSQTGFFLWGGPDPLTLWPSDWKPPPSSSLGTNLQFQSFRGSRGKRRSFDDFFLFSSWLLSSLLIQDQMEGRIWTPTTAVDEMKYENGVTPVRITEESQYTESKDLSRSLPLITITSKSFCQFGLICICVNEAAFQTVSLHTEDRRKALIQTADSIFKNHGAKKSKNLEQKS